MKRALAFLLVLATLLCMVPVMTSAAEPETPTGLGDYRDLYVKEGLVALFTAYEATASDTTLTSWTPANYYGIKGYEDYIDPSTYTASRVAANA